MRDVEAAVALTMARKFTPIAISNLLERFGSAAGIVGANPAEISRTSKVNRSGAKALAEVIQSGKHLKEIERAKEHGVALVCLHDDGYPKALTNIDTPPLLLYVKGELLPDDALAIGIVGSRSASYYGNAQAARFARDMGSRRLTVVSGLARGIDTAAHRAALEAGGRTIAVVGSGLLNVYPPENRPFVDEIKESGAVISEFPLDTSGVARNFPQRNRIISGLSLGVLVVEATEKSGSLITARTASEQGREVFALPGKVDSPLSSGPHKLIKDGAALVTDPADIYANLPMLELPQEDAPTKAESKVPHGLSPTEGQLWPFLHPSDGVTVDELIARSDLKAPQISSALTLLEMKRFAKSLPGNRYVRLET
ncbi:DNA-processing protein DprA [Planctomycetota bacterium]|nr:DNA-processing protein DprA [Planctomycetota bacterium]